jgi:hypothetical protein
VTEAVIIATARTPIGRARKGTLVGLDAFHEHPRRGTTVEVLATLPVLHPSCRTRP